MDDYYFPMELTNPVIRKQVRELGFKVKKVRLGIRKFEAAMIPCKNTAMENGCEVFIPTTTEEQRQRYLSLVRDELNEQYRARVEGRCVVPNTQGKLVRCQLKRCDGCPYRDSKPENVSIEELPLPAPEDYDMYEAMGREFVRFVESKEPKLAKLAQLRLKNYSQTECAKMMGVSCAAVHKSNEKLKKLMKVFLDWK